MDWKTQDTLLSKKIFGCVLKSKITITVRSVKYFYQAEVGAGAFFALSRFRAREREAKKRA
jgi:hypothetical protein